jgi:hypothetical protein
MISAEKLNKNIVIKHENKTKIRSNDYRQYYTPRTIELVAEVYRKDIELFGYSF